MSAARNDQLPSALLWLGLLSHISAFLFLRKLNCKQSYFAAASSHHYKYHRFHSPYRISDCPCYSLRIAIHGVCQASAVRVRQ
jgi:hypothetical protein